MLTNSAKFLYAFLAFTLPFTVVTREIWLERDNRAVFLYPRRFGQEQPSVLTKLREACLGEVCGNLAGQAVTPLLAAQPECSQQDMADAIIDASKQFDATTQANMVAIAIEYRQAEKNTPPDFSTNPPALRNSVFCQKAPKNPELNGLVQAQDPSSDPNLFFDPATQSTVRKGEQPNTFPFGQTGDAASSPVNDASGTTPLADDVAVIPTVVLVADGSDGTSGTDTPCPTAITITVTGNSPSLPTDAVTVTAGDGAATPTVTSATPSSTSGGEIGDFGSCTVPQIAFGAGFDGRKETSFEPVDKTSFNHGSAQNIDIIIQFICDVLSNSCNADQVAKNTCVTARAAASSAAKGTGAQADAFNDAFGIPTKFADVTALDTAGKPIPGTGVFRDGGLSASASGSAAASSASTSATSLGASVPSPSASSGSGRFGNFGRCSIPEIEFGTGFDNRRETSFQPVDKASFNHASAQNIDIITRAICDTLVNSCGADQTAISTCNTASAAASAATKNTGAQADAFNAAFGLSTNFAAIQPVGSGGNGGGSATSAPTPSATTSRATPTPTTPPSNNGGGNGNTGGNNNSRNLQTFSGALGGAQAPAVTDAGNGQFQVEGNSSFNNLNDALRRSCDVQVNLCSNAANASGNQGDFTVANCGRQGDSCRANL